MFFKIEGSLKFRNIHKKLLMLESLSNQDLLKKGLLNFIKKRLQHRCFPVNIAKLFKNSFLYRLPPVAAFGYSNQWKIFREISASKFQGQHAA